MNSGTIEKRGKGAIPFRRIERLQRIIMLGALAAITTFHYGCVKDGTGDSPSTIPNADDVEVMIIMNVPAVAATRAMTEVDENSIGHLDVIVFVDNGQGVDETFLYKTHATDYVPSADGTTSAVKVGFRKSRTGESHRFVFIANMRDEIEALAPSWTEDMTKAEVLETITFEAYSSSAATDADRGWDTDTPRLLPMWGETEQTHVVTSSLLGSALKTIKMLRAVATVDIVLNPDNTYAAQGFGTDFTLGEIKVYNVPRQGYAAPDPDTYAAGLPSYSTTFSRSAATVIGYATDVSLDEDKYGISRLIYIPEAPNTDGSDNNIDDNEQTCLVISGSYKGGAPTWYRLDFIDKLSSTENIRYDILRNHRYTFYITSVDGPGYDDEETAFRSGPLNLDTEIIVWDDEGKMNDIEFDGQYHLSVNVDSLYFYQEGRERILNITTNHPDGWQIEYTTETAGWVIADPDTSPVGWVADETSDIKITCDPIATPIETDRDGYIIIKAGKLRKYIKIYQANEQELTIEVNPTFIQFRKSGSNPKGITVKVYPENSEVYFAETPGEFPIIWKSGLGPSDHSGYPVVANGTYNFQPEANDSDPIKILTSIINVYITSPNGSMASKQITVRQLIDDLKFEVTKQTTYPYSAGTYSFSVDSYTDWHVKNIIAPAGMINNAELNTDYPDGTTVYNFDLSDNHSWNTRKATFQFGSTDIDFAGGDEDIIQNFVSPSLMLGNTTLTFGNTTSTANQSVTVISNAKWKYTIRDGTAWAYTIEPNSESPAAGAEGGSETFITTTQQSVSFAPRQYLADAGTPAAGTTYTTYADFITITGGEASEATGTLEITRTVPAYWTAGTLTGNTLSPYEIGRFTVSATSNAEWGIQATVTNGLETKTAVQSADSYDTRSLYVDIPANTTWNTNTITLEYTGNGSGYIGSGTYTQAGYVANISHAALTTVEGGGFTIRVSSSSYMPVILVGATGTGLSVQGTLSAGTTNSRYVDLVIPNNSTGASRTITIQYSLNGGATWSNVNSTTYIQPRGNVQLSSGRIVAKADALSGGLTGEAFMSWTDAMGVNTSFGNTHFYTSYGGDVDNRYYTPQTTTGCGGYYETESDIGKWRLPTFNEIYEIWTQHESEAPIQYSALYKTSSERPEYPTNNWDLRTRTDSPNPTNSMKNGNGTSQPYGRARCVREP